MQANKTRGEHFIAATHNYQQSIPRATICPRMMHTYNNTQYFPFGYIFKCHPVFLGIFYIVLHTKKSVSFISSKNLLVGVIYKNILSIALPVTTTKPKNLRQIFAKNKTTAEIDIVMFKGSPEIKSKMFSKVRRIN
jgi:hypothetical protein